MCPNRCQNEGDKDSEEEDDGDDGGDTGLGSDEKNGPKWRIRRVIWAKGTRFFFFLFRVLLTLANVS